MEEERRDSLALLSPQVLEEPSFIQGSYLFECLLVGQEQQSLIFVLKNS